MRAVTEFQSLVLQKILTAKTALASEGKTPEEISQSVGESFKLEGDKLKYALAASDLVKDKPNARRVLVVTFAEGEAVNPKVQTIEETNYLVDIFELRAAPVAQEHGGKGGPRRGGKGGGGPKSSPWGMSPEEKAAKNKPKAAKPTA